jgi:DMSO reductase anchor subunit
MNPAFSIIIFTTLAGSAQGLVVFLALGTLAGADIAPVLLARGLGIASVLLIAGLAASFFHLGRPLIAWRAFLMWRTSWMSREVIVLPAFILLVSAWAMMVHGGFAKSLEPFMALLGVGGALLLWYCTAMIYACLRFVQEWAHPLTVVNYAAIGLSTGLVLATALAVLAGDAVLAHTACLWALAATLLAWLTRVSALRRNDRLRPRSTLQSATGIRSTQLAQTSMGMTGGSFNTREFFHKASLAGIRRIRLAFLVFAFAVPSALLAASLLSDAYAFAVVALPLQAVGVLAERWFFFAQARHPQNLYYQVVS